jgi:hypothetical protein
VTAVLWVLLGVALGALSALGRGYRRGVRHGRRLAELEHGWVPRSPIRHKRRRDWGRRNRQSEPQPDEPIQRPVFHY